MATLLLRCLNRSCASYSASPYMQLQHPYCRRLLQSTITLVKIKEDRDENTMPARDTYNEVELPQCEISNRYKQKLQSIGIEQLNKMQRKTFHLVTQGENVVVQTPAGSGRTLAITLSLLHSSHLHSDTDTSQQSLLGMVLTATGERAFHVHSLFEQLKLKPLAVSYFVGGHPIHKQEDELRRGVNVLVGTPGRILDHINRGILDTSALKHLILDDTDVMSRMGLEKDVNQILTSVRDCEIQTLVFTEALTTWIRDFTKRQLNNNVKYIELASSASFPDLSHVYHRAVQCSSWKYVDVIKNIRNNNRDSQILISTRSRKASRDLITQLHSVDVRRIHEDTDEEDQQLILDHFRAGRFRCLIVSEYVLKDVEPDLPEVDIFVQTEPLSNIENYVNSLVGVLKSNGSESIVFYNRDKDDIVYEIERKANVKFNRYIAVEQNTVDNIVNACDDISPEAISSFLPYAKTRLQDEDAENVIACALALIAERNNLTSTSALMKLKGYQTYLCTQNWKLQGTARVISLLSEHFDSTFMESIQGIQTCMDGMSCVFDVPVSKINDIEEKWMDSDTAILRPIDNDQLIPLLKAHAMIDGEVDDASKPLSNKEKLQNKDQEKKRAGQRDNKLWDTHKVGSGSKKTKNTMHNSFRKK